MNRKRIAVLSATVSLLLQFGASAKANEAETVQLSGPVEAVEQVQDNGILPLIGIVADSQFQTRNQNRNVSPWRHPLMDKLFNVAIRPPALDWSSRYLLEGHLRELQANGARVIFFLGDGANNGCYDEFLNGFQDARDPPFNERGVLRILDDFRRSQMGIPVYFVLGNHDFMAAGSTSEPGPRNELCDDNPQSQDANRPLNRYEVIQAIDAFNRGNSPSSEFAADYWSNVSPQIREMCLRGRDTPTADELRQRGCYYAAVLDYPNRINPLAQLFLFDTTDNANATAWGVGHLKIESLRGAMSFRGKGSQTAFFMREAARAGRLQVRLAFTHYPVRALPMFNLVGQHKTPRWFLAPFVETDGSIARPRQEYAFVISGHTHSAASHNSHHIKALHGRYRISDLNIGSTTDSSETKRQGAPPHAALLRLRQPTGEGARITLEYQVMTLPPAPCRPIYIELELEWPRFGIVAEDPYNYRHMTVNERLEIFHNLRARVELESEERGALMARCIGLRSSEIETRGSRSPSTSR